LEALLPRVVLLSWINGWFAFVTLSKAFFLFSFPYYCGLLIALFSIACISILASLSLSRFEVVIPFVI